MSMIQEMVKATGKLNVVITGADGQVKESIFIPNLVVQVGKNYIASRMKDTGSPNQMSHMGIGAGTTAADNGDTALGSELGRVSLSTAGGSVSTNVVTYAATFPPGTGTGAVTEAAILNASSSGTMLCRTVFAVVNKGADDTMTVTWTVTIS